MVMAAPDLAEDTIKQVLDQVAEICLSREFDDLRKELEGIYLKNNMDDALMTAFQDALYAMFAERDGVGVVSDLIFEK